MTQLAKKYKLNYWYFLLTPLTLFTPKNIQTSTLQVKLKFYYTEDKKTNKKKSLTKKTTQDTKQPLMNKTTPQQTSVLDKGNKDFSKQEKGSKKKVKKDSETGVISEVKQTNLSTPKESS